MAKLAVFYTFLRYSQSLTARLWQGNIAICSTTLPDHFHYRANTSILLALTSQIGMAILSEMGLFKPNIEKMRAKNDVKGLIKALGKGDDIRDEIRIAGAVEDALEDIGRRTTYPFIKALSDKDAGVRSGAAWILGNIKDARAQEPLIEALKDKDENVRWLTVTALGDIGGERAIGPISMVPTDDDESHKQMVGDALEKIRSRYPGKSNEI